MKVVGIGSDNLKEANLIVSGLKEMNEIIFA